METASKQLHAKFQTARALFEKSMFVKFSKADTVSTYILKLQTIEARFALTTGHIYIKASTGETGRLNANINFSRTLASEDFCGEIDRLVEQCEKDLRDAGINLMIDASTKPSKNSRVKITGLTSSNLSADIQRIIDVYPRNNRDNAAAGNVQFIDYDHCPVCSGEMTIDTGRSELHCCDSECGTIRELIGTVFDDSQFYSQEGQKAKSGTFNPNRHFQFWWSHILARELEDEIGDKDNPDDHYGESLLKSLRSIVVRERKVLRMLTINDIRVMLREIGRTDLNKNIPLILKKLTGIGPPHITDAIVVRVENLFTKAIEISERVRHVGRVNRNYYPYYIYKILDHLLSKNDLENRRVLYYIYIQSKETVEADDEDWEQICEELLEITYVPTDRTDAMKYQPI